MPSIWDENESALLATLRAHSFAIFAANSHALPVPWIELRKQLACLYYKAMVEAEFDSVEACRLIADPIDLASPTGYRLLEMLDEDGVLGATRQLVQQGSIEVLEADVPAHYRGALSALIRFLQMSGGTTDRGS